MPTKPLPSDWDAGVPVARKLPTPEEEALKSSLPQIPQWIKQAALPTAGAIGGGIGAPLIGIPPVIGQSIGGAAGEGLNQLLGITEPSLTQVGINAAFPAVFAGGAGLVRKGAAEYAKRSGVGRIVAQQEAVSTARALPEVIKFVESKPIYAELAKQNIDIPLNKVTSTISHLSAQERVAMEGQKIPALNKLLKGFSARIKPTGKYDLITGEPKGNLSFQEIWTSIKRIGHKINATEGTEKGALRKIYASLWDDLRSASTKLSPDAGNMLKTANQAYGREMAKSDLTEQVIKAINPQAGTGHEYINVKGILNWLNKTPDGEFFQKSLSKTEVGEIKNVLFKLIKTPSLPPPPMAPIGSGRILATKLAQGGAAGAATQYMTGDAATSAVVGAVTPLVIEKGSEYVAEALMTKGGRQFLLKLMQSGPIFNHQVIGALGEFLATQAANPPKSKGERLQQDINYRSIPSTIRPGPNVQSLPPMIGVE